MAALSRLHRSSISRAHIVITAMCVLAMLFAPASAADSWQEAGILIDYGDDRITWVWVPFEDPEITVFELLDRSDLDLVTVGFGGMGEAICQVDDTGCPVADCRTRMCQATSSSPFWRFLKLSGDEWAFMGAGVSGTKATDGDIYALSWSAEAPDLPVVTIDDIAQSAGADRDALAPVSVLHTDGESSVPNASPTAWAPAVGALVLVVTAAGVLVLRARSSRGAAA